MTCPKCKVDMKPVLMLSGNEHCCATDEPCYCDGPDAKIVWRCNAKTQVSKSKIKFCQQPDVTIEHLTDMQAINRWLAEHLK